MMKKKELELFLETVPDFTNPKPWLEQYRTPSSIVSNILFIAYGFHDILEKRILDLGCGTGIFAFGAKKLHASNVIGVDKDPECINQAKLFARIHHIDIKLICSDISSITEKVDTVIMNPPFGAQKQNLHADRVFLEKAIELSSVIYSLHLEHTIEYIQKYLRSKGKEGRNLQTYQFPLSAQFNFHTKLKDMISVALLQIK
jgi:putative methylase